MAKLVFDKQGERYYENGVSKGVLFVAKADGSGFEKGVPWNGLTTVTQSPSGAEVTPVYADNIKYLNLMSAEDFAATIECYTTPEEFDVCDGSVALKPGLKLGQQTRRKFAFCYQTKIGNDVNADLGYKIHIIYGCLAAPSERAYETVNDSPEAMTLSYEISTTPVEVTGAKPVAHIEIDSRAFGTGEGQIAGTVLQDILDHLYGRDADQEHSITEMDSELLLPDAIAALYPAQN